ncbi:hypothetical protein DL771_000666 [Monosporascus sp. 5C6A]|nr:hypothetical protein DL771_000666 [Monosporascus sp. 5C6A]
MRLFPRSHLLQIAVVAFLVVLLLANTQSLFGLDGAASFSAPGFSHVVSHSSFRSVVAYVRSVFDPSDTSFSRLACPSVDSVSIRYEHLRGGDGPNLKYFFALDLRQNIEVLSRLLASIVEVVKFLGPTECALSVVEGNSDDGTLEVLAALVPGLTEIGLPYRLQHSNVDPTEGSQGTDVVRIQKLAELRNVALAPLTNYSHDGEITYSATSTQTMKPPDGDTTVIFVNDVALCAEDMLELIHQRRQQRADMTCAMDWNFHQWTLSFYDLWIARTMGGHGFSSIPGTGPWKVTAEKLFPGEPETRARYDAKLPFQVFSCWNGLVAFTAAPLLGLSRAGEKVTKETEEREPLRFRASRKGECFSGEPTLFCKDLWWAGFNRIAVVPSVNVEYSNAGSKAVKKKFGYTSDWTSVDDGSNLIQWNEQPPDSVWCVNIPVWQDQTYRPWNETLV